MKGIPTKYKGVQFRSRLEAKWAAFFDLIGWPWQYEPFDLNGWIPDFLIPGAVPVLVEVKPIIKFDHNIAKEMTSGADNGAFAGDLMLVGCVIPVPAHEDGWGQEETRIGWLHESDGAGWESGWGGAVASDFSSFGQNIGLSHEIGWYGDRISGHSDGDHCFHKSLKAFLDSCWTEAGNRVQWKAPR